MTDHCSSLKVNLSDLQEIVERISRFRTLDVKLKDELLLLFQKLSEIREEIPTIFTLDIQENLLEEHLRVSQANVDTYFTLNKTLDDIELALSHLLDILENHNGESQRAQPLDTFVDYIEDCSDIAIQLRQWLQSRKSVIDAVLEYNEISVDHIDTLQQIIKKNVQTCFELEEIRFSSPVRHAPSFTIKELTRLLATTTESSDVKIPTFSSMDESLCRRFLRLKQSVLPIEKSLVEILPQRIEIFGRRDVANIEYMISSMTKRCKEISAEFEFMVTEINQLKTELVDKKWKMLFHNLTHELSFLFEEVGSLQEKISTKNYTENIQEKFRCQLRKKVRTIIKTFNAMERATELSLLDPTLIEKTELLSKRWSDLKPICEHTLSENDINDKENILGSITTKLKSLKVSNGKEHTELPTKNFGAALMRKMNIKPVMIAGSPASAEKINPFYLKSPSPRRSGSPDQLILHAVPSLPYRNREESIENVDTISTKSPKSLKALEDEKIWLYSQRKSKIPTFKVSTMLPANFLLTPPSRIKQQWTPYQQRGHSLRPPTPVSVLLTSSLA